MNVKLLESTLKTLKLIKYLDDHMPTELEHVDLAPKTREQLDASIKEVESELTDIHDGMSKMDMDIDEVF